MLFVLLKMCGSYKQDQPFANELLYSVIIIDVFSAGVSSFVEVASKTRQLSTNRITRNEKSFIALRLATLLHGFFNFFSLLFHSFAREIMTYIYYYIINAS